MIARASPQLPAVSRRPGGAVWATAAAIAALAMGAVAFGQPMTAAMIGAVAAIAAALWFVAPRPDWVAATLVAVTALNLSSLLVNTYELPSIAKLLIGLLILSTAVRALITSRDIVIDRWATIAVMAYACVVAATVFWAHDADMAFENMLSLWRDYLIAILIAMVATDFAVLRLLSRAAFLSLALVAALGTVQVATGSYDLDFGGLAKASLHHIAGLVDDYRLQGPLDDANAYGRILLIGVPLALFEVAHGGRGWWRAIGVAATCVLIVAIVFTYSRGALIGLALIAVAALWRFRGHWRAILPAGLIMAVFGAMIVPDTYYSRAANAFAIIGVAEPALSASPDSSVKNRIDEMALAMDMFADHPIGGVGTGNYQVLFQQYSLNAGVTLRHEDREAHSLFLEIAADTGLLGLGAFAAIILALARANLPLLRNRQVGAMQRDLAAAIALTIATYLVVSIVLHDSYPRMFWITIGMAMAAPYAMRPAVRRQCDIVHVGLNLRGPVRWPKRVNEITKGEDHGQPQ